MLMTSECAFNELRCEDGICIDETRWCDDTIDCLDASDEPPFCYLGE